MEGEIIQEHFSDIVTLLQSCVEPVADECFSKKLITPKTHTKIISSKEDKDDLARKLLSVVRDRYEQQKCCLEVFLKILETQNVFDDLIEKMRRSLEAKERERKASCTEDLEESEETANDKSPVKRKLSKKDSGYQDSLAENDDDYRANTSFDARASFDAISEQEEHKEMAPHSSSTPKPFQRVHSREPTDSGVSVDNSSYFDPSQETPYGRAKPVYHRPTAHYSQITASSEMAQLDDIEQITRSLRYSMMQKEAEKLTLHEQIDMLQKQLQAASKAKLDASVTLDKKRNKIKTLKLEKEKDLQKLKAQEAEIEQLKDDISKKETTEFKISTRCITHEKDIEDLRCKVTDAEQRIVHEEEQKKSINDKLQMAKDVENDLRAKICELERENIQKTLETRELIEDHVDTDEQMRDLQKQLSCEKKWRLTAEGHKSICTSLLITLIFVLALMALELFYEQRNENHCGFNPFNNRHLFS